jgi:hypothetical protein
LASISTHPPHCVSGPGGTENHAGTSVAGKAGRRLPCCGRIPAIWLDSSMLQPGGLSAPGHFMR